MPLNRAALGVIVARQEESRARARKQQDEEDNFNERLRLAGIQSGLQRGELGYNADSGRIENRQPPAFDPASLRPGERAQVPMQGGGYRTYIGPQLPKTPTMMTPSQQIQALSDLQRMELTNQDLIADATPKPTWYEQAMGIQAKAPTNVPGVVDTSTVRRNLSPYMSGQVGLGAPQASQVTQEDVSDLMAGIQQGMIQSRQQAVEVIVQAGLDPNDPAFAQILSQLP